LVNAAHTALRFERFDKKIPSFISLPAPAALSNSSPINDFLQFSTAALRVFSIYEKN